MLTYLVVFAFGAVMGSFLNVCIYRIPKGESLILPGSRCPECKENIAFYDNIPILSYIFLGGRCRKCNARISVRYPLVELLNGLFYVSLLVFFGFGIKFIIYALFLSSLIVITFIDIDHRIIPDVITLPGMLVGLTLTPFFITSFHDPIAMSLHRVLPQAGTYLTGFFYSFFGLLVGSTPLLAIGWLWEKFRKVEAMGGGDIKLMGMVGSFVGWKGAILTIFLGALTGSIIGILLILLKKQSANKLIPFGPFLALGATVSLFWGNDIISWYLGT